MTAFKASYSLRTRNPDVLSCIANLSSDEVFTPPDFANQMLDTLAQGWSDANGGADIWADSSVTFLDPFAKSGVFLREITKRLVEGLATEMPDIQERVDHILTRQVFGIGITEICAYLARRSLYCSKDATGEHSIAKSFENPDGNIWFERTEHTWAGGTDWVYTADKDGNQVKRFTNGRCVYCGANQNQLARGQESESHAYALIHMTDVGNLISSIFGENMQFDVVVGNPPYQLDDGGYGSSAAPVYHLFVEQAKALQPRLLSMVIPARWYAGGKGLDTFRASMLEDRRIRALHDFPSTSEVFPGVNIRGGVCYFLWDRDKEGDATVTTYGQGRIVSSSTRPLLEQGTDIFVRYNEGLEILKKVMRVENPGQTASVSLSIERRFSEIVSSRKPFGIPTNFKGAETRSIGQLRLFQNGGIGYVASASITQGSQYVDEHKLFVPYSSPGSDDYPHLVLSKPLLAEPGDVATETYLLIGPFADGVQSRNAAKYMASKLFRFLVILARSSQHITKRVYQFVPSQDFTKCWTDVELFAKYGITDEDEHFIDQFVKPVAWGEDFE